MTLAKKLRDDLVGLTPLFAVVGATDLAASKLRELGTPEGEFDPQEKPNLPRDVERLVRGVRRAPGVAFAHALDTVTHTQAAYDDLAGRGRALAGRSRPAGQDAEAAETARPGDERPARRRLLRTVETTEASEGTTRRGAAETTGPARRRRIPAAARAAAPGSTRPTLVDVEADGPSTASPEAPVAGRLAGRTATPTRRETPATPAVPDTVAPVRPRRRRAASVTTSTMPAEAPEVEKATKADKAPEVTSRTASPTPTTSPDADKPASAARRRRATSPATPVADPGDAPLDPKA